MKDEAELRIGNVGGNSGNINYIIDRRSLENLDKWISEIKEYGEESCLLFLVATHSDLIKKRNVEEEEAREYAMKKGLIYFETSSKLNLNIDQLFQIIAKIYLI